MAGNINPNLQLGLNQQASFNVVNPVDVLETITNQNAQEEIGRQRNFQSGVNNAIAQAAASMRNRQSEEAAMARQLEEQDYLRQEAAAQRAYEQQKALEESKLGTQKELADINKAISFSKDSMANSTSLNQHKLNLLAEKSKIQLTAAEKGLGNDPGIKNTLELIDNEIKATNLALGEKVNDVTPEISGMSEGIKSAFELKKSETLASLQENNKKLVEVEPPSMENTIEVASDMLGERPTDTEAKMFHAQDKLRNRALKAKKSADKFAENMFEYSSSTSPQLIQVDDSASEMQEAAELAQQYGVSIDVNAQSEIRTIIDTVANTRDSDAAIELLDEIKTKNIFNFPESTPPEIQREITNKYLTGLDQITGSSSFIARGAGNTGVLTGKDVAFAMKRYLSTNGNLDQFLDNLKKGRATTASQMMRQGYLYQDEEATATWRDILSETEYKLAPDFSATKKSEQDVVRDNIESFSQVESSGLTPEEEAELAMLEEQEAAGILDDTGIDNLAAQADAINGQAMQDLTDMDNNINAGMQELNAKDLEIQQVLKELGLQ